MPRMKKEVVPKLTTLPVSVEDRKLLSSLIEEAKQRLKGVVDVATDVEGKLNLEGKYFNALVKAKFDTLKVAAKAEELQSSVDDIEVLSNKA